MPMRWRFSNIFMARRNSSSNNMDTSSALDNFKRKFRYLRSQGCLKCIIIIFIVVCVVAAIVRWDKRNRYGIVTGIKRVVRKSEYYFTDTDADRNTSNYCIVGNLAATYGSAGLGNNLFEIITFYAAARKTSRIPVIHDKALLAKLEQKTKDFPKLREAITKNENVTCSARVVQMPWSTACCMSLEDSLEDMTTRVDKTIQFVLVYAQSFKNFDGLSVDDIKNLTEASGEIKKLTGSLFKKQPEVDAKNLCVHIRRGDFVKKNYTYPSDAPFCQAATEYIMKKENILPHNVYVFSNDQQFADDTYLHMYVNVATVDKTRPPSVEFEFSKQYCDVVLITAGISTYGWWLGYLSRGQQVYFNGNYTTPGSYILKELNPSDFFPPHWKPILLDDPADQSSQRSSRIHEITIDQLPS